jgi:hypothetical protein
MKPRIFFTLALIILCSCGKESGENPRCYTKEDAFNFCVMQEMLEYQTTKEVASLMCQPKFTIDMCYYLK